MSSYARTAGRTVAKYAPAVARGAAKRYRVYTPAIRQLASDVMYIKGLINSEPKSHYLTYNDYVDWNGTCFSLSSVPTGDLALNRDGNRILPRYLKIRFSLRKLKTSGVDSTTVRYIVFRWWGESPNAVGVNPSPGEIVGNIASVFAPLSPLQQSIVGPKGDRNRRIEVHRTGCVTLNNVNNLTMDQDINITLNGSNKPKEHMEFFDQFTHPPTSGGFFVLFISDTSSVTDMTLRLYSHLTFYDN